MCYLIKKNLFISRLCRSISSQVKINETEKGKKYSDFTVKPEKNEHGDDSETNRTSRSWNNP